MNRATTAIVVELKVPADRRGKVKYISLGQSDPAVCRVDSLLTTLRLD